jgi:phosphohistidine phosphatase SixA
MGSVMSLRIVRTLVLLVGICGAAAAARADETDAWAALRAGGHVALMRHTDAPGAAGDPPGFTLEDCATQRNLSAKGRADATAIGARIRSEGIAFEKILSSPWCRCLDTARLMDLGPVETEATFSNVVVLNDQAEALTDGARTLIRAWKGRGTLLAVTHGANIRALIGISPASGEIVVVAIGVDGSIEPIGRIPPPDR